MNRILPVLIATLILTPPAVYGATRTCDDPVPTVEGPVAGKASADLPACAYLGIPYAAPPTGELRWKAPGPAPARTGVFEALEYGASCPQKESFLSGGKSASIDEDCLYLNVFRPEKSGIFPVMFWIHGGGYTGGSGSYEVYDGSRLAADRDVAVVTLHYRLGPLGFLALPGLAEEDPNGYTGNYGLMDTIRGLEWVRDNIEGFGGDPENVTIFGQSAGGVSVCSLLVSPPAAGLFHRAVIQSGGCDLASDLEKQHEKARELALSLGCEDPDPIPCLRALPVKKLMAAKGFIASASVDGCLLPARPIDLIREGRFNRVPVMVGANKDELNIALALVPGLRALPKCQVEKLVRKSMGEKSDRIFEMYSFEDYRRPIFLVGALLADGFNSRAYAAAEALSTFTPVYMYRFDWDEEFMGRNAGAFHALENPLVFGNLKAKSSPLSLLMNKKAMNTAAPLSETMMSYWSNFARSADPNGPGLVEWPRYHSEGKERLLLDSRVTVSPIDEIQVRRYEFFASQEAADLGF